MKDSCKRLQQMVEFKDGGILKTELNVNQDVKYGHSKLKNVIFKDEPISRKNENLKFEKLTKEIKDKNMEIINLKNEIFNLKKSTKSNSTLQKVSTLNSNSEVNSIDKHKKTLNMIKKDKMKHVSLNDTEESN